MFFVVSATLVMAVLDSESKHSGKSLYKVAGEFEEASVTRLLVRGL